MKTISGKPDFQSEIFKIHFFKLKNSSTEHPDLLRKWEKMDVFYCLSLKLENADFGLIFFRSPDGIEFCLKFPFV